MLWESWDLLILFIGGLITALSTLLADLRESDRYQPRTVGHQLELSTGSSYPTTARHIHGRHRAAIQAGRWRR